MHALVHSSLNLTFHAEIILYIMHDTIMDTHKLTVIQKNDTLHIRYSNRHSLYSMNTLGIELHAVHNNYAGLQTQLASYTTNNQYNVHR